MILPRNSPFRRPNDDPRLSAARRVLFGPVDPEETLRHAREELARMMETTSKRWNFDFANGVPLPGRYEWESVTPVKTASLPSKNSVQVARTQSKITDYMRPRKLSVSPRIKNPSGIPRIRRYSAPSTLGASTSRADGASTSGGNAADDYFASAYAGALVGSNSADDSMASISADDSVASISADDSVASISADDDAPIASISADAARSTNE